MLVRVGASTSHQLVCLGAMARVRAEGGRRGCRRGAALAACLQHGVLLLLPARLLQGGAGAL